MVVKSGLLDEDLKEEVYVEQPLCFHKTKSKRMVYSLKKALHGLKQAMRR